MTHQGIGDPRATTLEAFGRDGIHCGSARREPWGLWVVKEDGNACRTVFVDTEEEARKTLREFGAVTIRAEPDGPR